MRDPVELAAAYLEVPSVTGDEAALARLVGEHLDAAGLRVEVVAGCVVARNHGGDSSATLLVGHLDTVPGELPVAVDELVLRGRGAVDMKAGLAVAVALACSEPSVPVTVVAYPGEEGPITGNGLAHLVAERPELLAGARGVLLEPTGGFLELGCQGVVRATLRLRGRRAHVARAWMGRNAIDRVGEALGTLRALERREPQIGPVRYREAIEVVGVRGGVAWNVVPDLVEIDVSYRFAPDLDAARARQRLEEAVRPVMDDGDDLEVAEAVPGAVSDLGRFGALRSGAFGVRAKLGWTDVAQLVAAGVPAVNFGPGDPELAHTDQEMVEVAEVRHVAQALWRWLHA
ncbi:peptidase M20 [Acidimicrobium ferrooxidans DSM 10331]|uniref:Succinyl-diaminopimelate desuccinylase n=1 Tax=Acidimicrobium ferrooxidans (strain DSM 10331 / JCM 15462 / NBRC 103882 / ICP) TaxID=525909 RepID=C7LY07_ACIFD|nr:succinyl-diaminopimelate desuccinylase [Acidimicrobium ferrooxidans]ACU53615.1 peptidase M20 [Acidimicrobium ferrooxidans DSM 10331]